MNLIELSALMQDEKKCEEYLRQVGILKTFTNCVKCDSEIIGAIRRNRIRCYSCKYEWNIRKGSVLEGMILESSKFIACIKMFELGIPVTHCTWELNIANETAVQIYHIIRIYLIDTRDEEELKYKYEIFNEKLKLDILLLKTNNRIKVVWKSIEDDKYISECAVISTNRITNELNQITYNYFYKHSRNYVKEKVKTYDLIDRFWSYAKPKLKNLAISKIEDLYLYLKELEFRFNNRNIPTFENIIKKLSKSD
jgi:transposase